MLELFFKWLKISRQFDLSLVSKKYSYFHPGEILVSNLQNIKRKMILNERGANSM